MGESVLLALRLKVGRSRLKTVSGGELAGVAHLLNDNAGVLR